MRRGLIAIGAVAFLLAAITGAASQTQTFTNFILGAQGGTPTTADILPCLESNSGTTLTYKCTVSAVWTMLRALANTWSGPQEFNSSTLVLNGATSGTTVLNPQAVASGTVSFPAATGTAALLSLAQIWSGPQEFNANEFVLNGSSSGTTVLNAAPTASGTATLPANTGTLAETNLAQTWSALQQFNSSDLALKGASSGTLTLNAAASAGTNTITLPAGTTDFSATGGTSQVVKQTSAGGAFTVAQLACSDLSTACFTLIGQQSQAVTGTYTPAAGTKYVRVYCTAVGGNGGTGGVNAGGGAGGGSGGSGETRIGVFTAAQIGSSQTVTIGAAGNNTTFGALLTAVFGGAGGNATGQVPGSPGAAGTGGSGGIGITGSGGNPGSAVSAGNNAFGATGAPSYWGGAGVAGLQGAAGGNGAQGGGGGGGGGSASAGGAGGNGGAGFCVEQEYG